VSGGSRRGVSRGTSQWRLQAYHEGRHSGGFKRITRDVTVAASSVSRGTSQWRTMRVTKDMAVAAPDKACHEGHG